MKIRRIYETCCATGALTLKLVGGPRAKPVISGMGCKQGFAGVILGLVGVRQGQGCEQVFFIEPGPWGLAWPILASRGDEVAAVLRGWQGREPRALWDECKAIGWGEMEGPEEVGRWVLVGGNADAHGNWTVGDHGHGAPESAASRVSAVARWLVSIHWSFSGKGPDHGYGGPGCPGGDWGMEARDEALSLAKLAGKIPRLPVPLAVYHGSALDIAPFADTTGEDLLYCDPPYLNTTGYKDVIYAEDLKPRLLEWSEAGAMVLISEARPLAELMGPGGSRCGLMVRGRGRNVPSRSRVRSGSR